MVKQYVMLVSILVWAGCIVAISFMESWLKFRASGVTLPIGLSIGKLVFNALNKMEWIFAATLLAGYFFNTEQTGKSNMVFFGLAFWMLIMQTFWLLPALDTRANIILSGKRVTRSSLHWYFAGAEVIKLGSLLALGFAMFNGFMAVAG